MRVKPPVLHNITAEDLRDTGRLLELHAQAIEAGHQVRGDKGRLEFFALAERARSHGHDAPRLFAWLLREGRFDFITQAEEDAAMQRLRRHRNQGEGQRRCDREKPARPNTQQQQPFIDSLSDGERFVHVCIITARKNRLDPFRLAQAKGWTRDRWEDARLNYELAEKRRWHADEQSGRGFFHLMDFEKQ